MNFDMQPNIAPQQFTNSTRPVLDSSNPLGEGKILSTDLDEGEGKIKVAGMPTNANNSSGI